MELRIAADKDSLTETIRVYMFPFWALGDVTQELTHWLR